MQLSQPQTRGSILLAGKDPLIPPLIDPNYLDNDHDISVILEGMYEIIHNYFSQHVLMFKIGLLNCQL